MTQDLTVGNQSIMLSPQDVVTNATLQAKLLMDIVEKTKCFQVISGKRYLQVEAWETIGAFNRVHAVTESITPIISDGALVGYDAKVNLLNQNGVIVGSAIMPCYFTENACKGKEGDAKDKACKSAAQTFAESKVYRMNYSYIAILAGYEPTPAEEMAGTEPTHDEMGHFCGIHNTPFFKRGKMTCYAHPLDNGTWCNEPLETPKTGEAPQKVAQAPPDATATSESKGLTAFPSIQEVMADLNVVLDKGIWTKEKLKARLLELGAKDAKTAQPQIQSLKTPEYKIFAAEVKTALPVTPKAEDENIPY